MTTQTSDTDEMLSCQTEFHWLLGPSLMIAFAFLGNTLFLTILVSILSNTFAAIARDAAAEIQYRKAVVTLEGVKSDAIFAYQPPFNILAVFFFVPLQFVLSPRWFHKIHVATVRLVNLPILLAIALMERRVLWTPTLTSRLPRVGSARLTRPSQWFWQRWNIAARQDIRAVFDMPPPDTVEEAIAADDELTHHLIRRQYTHRDSTHQSERKFRRRDSTYPGLAPQMRGSVEESEEALDISDMDSRLSAVEASTARIERLLEKLCSQEERKKRPVPESTDGSATLKDVDG